MTNIATDSFRRQLGGFLCYTRVRHDFCFYDTPVATRLSISMSGSTAFKRCILGGMAVRTTTIDHASYSGGWSIYFFGHESFFWEASLNTVLGLEVWVQKSWFFHSGFFGSGISDILFEAEFGLYTPYLEFYNTTDFAVTHRHLELHSDNSVHVARDCYMPRNFSSSIPSTISSFVPFFHIASLPLMFLPPSIIFMKHLSNPTFRFDDSAAAEYPYACCQPCERA